MRRRSTVSPAFRYGIRFGILLGLVQIVVSLLTTYNTVGPWASTLGLVGVVVAALIYLLAGLLAARRTGRVGTGSFAGLWTGVIGSLIGFLGALIITYVNIDRLRQQAEAAAHAAAGQVHQTVPAVTNQGLLLAALLAGVLGILFSLVLGLILGALGGLIGRELFRPASIATHVPPNEGPRSTDTLSPPPSRD